VTELETIIVPEETPDPYPYPMWSPAEEVKLRRWYPVLGATQCVEFWEELTGRIRGYKQIDRKAQNIGIQNYVHNDWLELFED